MILIVEFIVVLLCTGLRLVQYLVQRTVVPGNSCRIHIIQHVFMYLLLVPWNTQLSYTWYIRVHSRRSTRSTKYNNSGQWRHHFDVWQGTRCHVKQQYRRTRYHITAVAGAVGAYLLRIVFWCTSLRLTRYIVKSAAYRTQYLVIVLGFTQYRGTQ